MLLQLQAQQCSFWVSDRIGSRRKRRVRVGVAACVRVEDLVLEIAHNKVLISAAASAAIGQLVKPFAATLFYGKDFDLKTSLLAGGFPSTHSSAVVAAATSIGLERGFSDSIFGLTVIYAALIMYDAQGVRREVGIHAKTLNSVIMPKLPTPFKVNDELPKTISSVTSRSRSSILDEESSSFASEPNNTPYMLEPGLGTDSIEEVTGRVSTLKESIGHTEVEVIAGGFLGFFASLAVFKIM